LTFFTPALLDNLSSDFKIDDGAFSNGLTPRNDHEVSIYAEKKAITRPIKMKIGIIDAAASGAARYMGNIRMNVIATNIPSV